MSIYKFYFFQVKMREDFGVSDKVDKELTISILYR